MSKADVRFVIEREEGEQFGGVDNLCLYLMVFIHEPEIYFSYLVNIFDSETRCNNYLEQLKEVKWDCLASLLEAVGYTKEIKEEWSFTTIYWVE